MLEFAVTTPDAHTIAHGLTDNPYTVRNVLRQYFEPSTRLTTVHEAITPSHLRIWCSAELAAIMRDTPIVQNNTHLPPAPLHPPVISTGPTINLQQLCKQYKLNPARARRRLRAHQGIHHRRYTFAITEIENILEIIK